MKIKWPTMDELRFCTDSELLQLIAQLRNATKATDAELDRRRFDD